jgi:hypothetical protein
MIISDQIKQKIQQEYIQWVNIQYGTKTKEERQKLGQFFTPPELSIQMLEKYNDLNGTILDPTAGCGGLLAAAVIAGANPRKCFGIEFDPETVALCRERLAKLGVPRMNIHVGDALLDDSYDFEEVPNALIYFKVENIGFGQVRIFIEHNSKSTVVQKEFVIDYSKKDKTIQTKFQALYKLFNMVNGKNTFLCVEQKKYEGRMKFMNAFFKKYVGKTFNFNKKMIIFI